MEFLEVGYAYLVPILLIVWCFAKGVNRIYIICLIAVFNVSLLFFVVQLCREYYGLYKLAKAFGFNVTPKGLMLLFSTNIPIFLKNVAVTLLPLLFLFRRLNSNLFLSITMLVLLWWDYFYGLFTHKEVPLIGNNYSSVIFLVLNSFSLYVGLYGLLWLWKKLPICQKIET
jgi:hypothetical protein